MRKNRKVAPIHVPTSTYRLQLNRFLGFEHAAQLVPYLDDLGVGAAYVSPILKARAGSLHGYDVTDHSSLNLELGSLREMQEFAGELRQRNMGLVLDIVPNHMCVSDEANSWWWDVLENGQSSLHASWFDIDWTPPKEDLCGKVLLPILGDQFGKVLEACEIRLVFDAGTFSLCYGTTKLPVAPRTWRLILEPCLEELRRDAGSDHPDVLEFESILTALSYLPPRTEIDPEKIRERQREKEIVKRRLAQLAEESRRVLSSIEAAVLGINGSPTDPRSLDRLERLLADQVYRLSHWRVAADEINYRRFFDINDLAAIRVEMPEVFAAVHSLVLDLIKQGLVTGLRIDHPDGLFDPQKYFEDVQDACRAALAAGAREGSQLRKDLGAAPFFVVAEKILVGDEALRPWAIEGTTGYGFLNFLNGVFVDRTRRRAFDRIYRSFTGSVQSYEDLVYTCKKLILQVSMSSELNVLARQLDRISEQHRWSRDFTFESLRDALKEIVACFPVYRTYIRGETWAADPEDERHILVGVASAKARNPAISESIYDFIQSLLLLQSPAGLTEMQLAERRNFLMRFQQFTGPVMAKGLEDTAFYRFFPLASLNEVGGDLRVFGYSPAIFHKKSRIRLGYWPNALLSSATHDTKRSEDVRSRVNVLSEIPAEWNAAIDRWHTLNASHRKIVAGQQVPGRNGEYLLYQTLLGTWPLGGVENEEEWKEYSRRIEQYMAKAANEAKIYTSWVNPNRQYDDALGAFIRDILAPEINGRFLDDFRSFQAPVAWGGFLNSLSQQLLKIASPGVPDLYQGTELWDLSLVDPDNRRLVDFELRRRLMAGIAEEEVKDPAGMVERLLRAPEDGRIKLYLTRSALRFRRSNSLLFSRGGYVALSAMGKFQKHVIAFARTMQPRTAIAAVGRFFLTLGCYPELPVRQDVWGDDAIVLARGLAGGEYRDVFTGRVVSTTSRAGRTMLPLSEVFSHAPFALLVHDA